VVAVGHQIIPQLALGKDSMLSVVIATHDSERALLPTLAALVAGAAAGVVREVIIADAGSRDATDAIADGAGCRAVSYTI
jgi:glycosyltransferase involved in cell wall biosynthesis